MKLIVGLGNPGKKYEYTRHNFGFLVVEELANKYNGKFYLDKRFKAEICEVFIDGEKIILAKPQTFMNESGEAVRTIISYFDITTDRVWVIYDDIDIDLGTVRVRNMGSSAGHRGMQSILDHLGTTHIARFKMGIKSANCDELSTEDVVLKNFCKDEDALVKEAIQKAISQIETALKSGIEHLSI